ncbi:MAG TPA: threonine synthase [Micropepsaceae bacterium]|nr:threonine synthase [Micropepsaceae bacterium]
MEFVSTRGGRGASFEDVLLGGPAPDGGLYLPHHWPVFSLPEIREMASANYADVTTRVLAPFAEGYFTAEELHADAEAAYATFRHRAIAPLNQLASDLFLLELFHGPTLAFKDIALQLMSRLFARALARRKNRATVIAATSGDTGSAAIAAFCGQPGLNIVVLHPKGRVSEMQQRQMTTVMGANVHNIALEGNFDDTQAIVKSLFNDIEFSRRTNLTAVNSINLVRILAQAVYYFTAAAALGAGFGRAINFAVPTGNFGDVFAGEAAARMGLPVARLVIGTNLNDILVRSLRTGSYAVAGDVQPTFSPSMDIQVASNFERALFECSGRNAAWIGDVMAQFRTARRFEISRDAMQELGRRYIAAKTGDEETLSAIRETWRTTGMIIDPHTAVGLGAYRVLHEELRGPVVALSTAHPAKFPDAITRAIGRPPELPEVLAGLSSREERYTVLPNSVPAVRDFILSRTDQQ